MLEPLSFKEFSRREIQPRSVFLSEAKLDALKSRAEKIGFERGQKSARADQQHTSHQNIEFVAHKLDEISQTQAETQTRALDSLSPLLAQIIDVILPCVITHGLPELIHNRVLALMGNVSERPIEIVCSEKTAPAVERALKMVTDERVNVVVTPNSAVDSESIVIGNGQIATRVWTSDALLSIQNEVALFFENLNANNAKG